ncbi:unnamed protein product [Ectocarpus sp. 13 AM-2016]
MGLTSSDSLDICSLCTGNRQALARPFELCDNRDTYRRRNEENQAQSRTIRDYITRQASNASRLETEVESSSRLVQVGAPLPEVVVSPSHSSDGRLTSKTDLAAPSRPKFLVLISAQHLHDFDFCERRKKDGMLWRTVQHKYA